MLVTTTPTIEGHVISEYLGIVHGDVVIGVNMFKDMAAGIRNIVGGRSVSYEKELMQARKGAIEELQSAAEALGADAVCGVDFDYEAAGAGNMFLVIATGTAVRLD